MYGGLRLSFDDDELSNPLSITMQQQQQQQRHGSQQNHYTSAAPRASPDMSGYQPYRGHQASQPMVHGGATTRNNNNNTTNTTTTMQHSTVPLSDDTSVVATLEMWRNKVQQQGAALHALEEEERLIHHEEAALRRQLEDVNHRHRTVDRTMLETQQGWHEVHKMEMHLVTQPPPDLGPKIADANVRVTLAREKHDQISERLGGLQKQLASLEHVEARRKVLDGTLDKLQEEYMKVEDRRRQLQLLCQHFADIEADRDRQIRKVLALLDAEDDTISAQRKKVRNVTIQEPSSASVPMPMSQPTPAPSQQGYSLQPNQPVGNDNAPISTTTSISNVGMPIDQPMFEKKATAAVRPNSLELMDAVSMVLTC